MEIYAVRCDVRFTQGTHLEGENGTQKKRFTNQQGTDNSLLPAVGDALPGALNDRSAYEWGEGVGVPKRSLQTRVGRAWQSDQCGAGGDPGHPFFPRPGCRPRCHRVTHVTHGGARPCRAVSPRGVKKRAMAVGPTPTAVLRCLRPWPGEGGRVGEQSGL